MSVDCDYDEYEDDDNYEYGWKIILINNYMNIRSSSFMHLIRAHHTSSFMACILLHT